ncbi:hypothetical protein Q9L58_006859 [Maublancomyces gigas]|uniref:HNH nuclease domain-containing protein n=1 Tax=Discina gigas TaxID=1032678 RepID=A0ABR3GFB1_9PEZI
MSRSLGRDVHIYDTNDPATVLGGLILSNGITNANFYSMVEIIFIFDSDYFLRDANGIIVQRDNHPFHPGNYYILTNGSMTINNEPWLVRAISVTTGPVLHHFAMMSAREIGNAAHIFPLAYEGHWMEHNYSHWITIQPSTGGPINSVQNGMLLTADAHALFDSYKVSINPDDNYKIVCFDGDGLGVGGRHLDQQLLRDDRRPVDQVLRWHFRQAVLANMKGAGEPVFENDFPPGSDMIGEILDGPKAAERMEFELFTRLAGVT